MQIDLSSVAPGFVDPVLDAQSAFRTILLAMSEPGTPVKLDHQGAPAGLHPATAAAALTLMDVDTPVWVSPGLQTPTLESWLRFHCSCPLLEVPGEAAFALIAEGDGDIDLDTFNAGDPKYPDRSTTIVFQLPSLDAGGAIALEGPGVPDTRAISPDGLPKDFWDRRAHAVSAFQLGIDIMLVSGEWLIGLPRTTRRVVREENGRA